ncbi:MAG: hypothetical protein NQ127_04030 [Candidatus Cardinium sp.]|nr:hypothetical protein [Candidatus Cardinium sp.]
MQNHKTISLYGSIRLLTLPYKLLFMLCTHQSALALPGVSHRSPGDITLSIQHQNFINNTEYFNKIMEGGTLFGFHFLPSIHLAMTDTMGIQAGCIWSRTFGHQWPWMGIRPVFSMCYRKQQNIFIVGIFNNAIPTLIEPLSTSHQPLEKPHMEGFHFRLTQPTSHIAGWLDWKNCLCKKNNKPEIVTFQLDASYGLKHTNWSIPLQLAVYHLGGQGIPIQSYSLWCAAVGLTYALTPTNTFLKKVQWASYLVGNSYAYNRQAHERACLKVERPFKEGWGHFHTLTIALHPVEMGVSYWYGNKFSSENMGYPLYQSICIQQEKDSYPTQVTYYEKIRHLLFVSFAKTWEISNGITLQTSLKPYCDLVHNLLEYGFSLQLSYTGNFHLTALDPL